MRKKMRNAHKAAALLIMVCLLPVNLPAVDQPPGEAPGAVLISMDFQDASLKDILKLFSIQSGLNFIASEAVQDRTITLFLDKVPLKESMDKLFKANNLTYELDAEAKIFIVKDWGKPQVETMTKVFPLKYATVSTSSLMGEVARIITVSGGAKPSGITEAVKKLLSPAGSLIEDHRTNSLIVTEIPGRMPLIESLITSLDIASPQIMLEVEMLDVSKNVVDELGFEWGTNPFTLILGEESGSRFFIGDAALRGATQITSATAGAFVFGRTFAQKLDLLRTNTETKYLARPKLLTLNNETAEIRITTNESIGITTTTEASTGSSSATPERTDTGVSLRITPQANLDTGEITMFIYPEVTEAALGSTLTSGDLSFIFKDPETRSTKSVVRIKDNQTVLIGGLIRNEYSNEIDKIPILGDIPIIGALFRHASKTKDKERELIVFITPRIVKENNSGLAKAQKMPDAAVRGYLVSTPAERMLAIESSLNSFEKIN